MKKRNTPERRRTQPGLVLEPHQVILKPLVTEKGIHQSEAHNQYTFQVNPAATKSDVRNAVEKLFEVTVTKVVTQHRRGKPRRYKFTTGRTKNWKKAIVTLPKEQKIEFF
jgi:large subunit ribosomal protein L23